MAPIDNGWTSVVVQKALDDMTDVGKIELRI